MKSRSGTLRRDWVHCDRFLGRLKLKIEFRGVIYVFDTPFCVCFSLISMSMPSTSFKIVIPIFSSQVKRCWYFIELNQCRVPRLQNAKYGVQIKELQLHQSRRLDSPPSCNPLSFNLIGIWRCLSSSVKTRRIPTFTSVISNMSWDGTHPRD